MKPSCDHHQQTISDCLDDQRELPEATHGHLSHCETCRMFREMWQDDSAPLSSLARIRELPQVPPSLAQDIAAARKTVTGPWKRSLPRLWPAIAAALAMAAGVFWWNAGRGPAGQNPIVNIAPDVSPRSQDMVDLSQVITRLDTEGIGRSLAIYTKARTRSLDRSGQRYARMTLNLRNLTSSFAEFIPTVE